MSKPKIEILVVDDDPALRQLLTMVLSKSGYAVRSAHDGFSALAAIRTAVPDILLSDLYMPGMSGFELLSVVRRRFPMIPVIAMSSAYSGPDVPAGIAADAFYEKATDLHDLLKFVNGMGMLRVGPQAMRKNSISPVWIARKMDGSDATEVALACPECMRTFSEVLGDSLQVIREAGCLHCSTRIHYALVGPAGFAARETVVPALADHVRLRSAA